MRGGDDDVAFTSLAVVLEAKQPLTTKGLWSPELNPDNGLMGNSYIQPKHAKTVDLIAVHYRTPKGWVRKPLQKTIRI